MFGNKLRQDFIYIFFALLIVVGIYTVGRLIDLNNKPSEFVIARNGRIINYEQDVAYVIRDEHVLETEDADKEKQIIISDGNRAAKGDTIATVVLEDSLELKEQINEIDIQIQSLMTNVQPEYSQDLKSTENNLETSIYNYIKDKNNLETLKNKKKNIDELLEKKVKLIAASSEKGSDLNKLVNERISIEKEINKKKSNIKADRPGLVSYRVDGWEEKLTPNNFSNITSKMLKEIKYTTDQAIPSNTEKIKIINNFYAYLVIVSKTEEGKKLMLNDTVKFTTSNNLKSLSKGTVDYIINDEDTRYIFVKTTDNIEKLAQYRKLTVNVVWWNYQGIKVPNESIFDDEVLNSQGDSIVKLKAINIQAGKGYTKKVWIKVENSAGGYSIIDNYDNEELKELGLSDDMIDSRNKLNLYDKVILAKK